MESEFKVKITPKKMSRVFNEIPEYKVSAHVKFFEFLGIETEGDFDSEKCSDEEWETVRNKPCIYRVILRHEELPSYLKENYIYPSWGAVLAALRRRKKRESNKA